MKLLNLSRRRFLQGSAALGASGLLIGCSADMPEVQLQSAASAPIEELDNWLFIGTDNQIIITIPAAEMGQGVNTSLAQLVADELDADWNLVEVRQAPLNSKFANAMGIQMTGGSMAIKDYFMPMRQVGAAAKQMLITAAAAQLGTQSAQLKCDQSHIIWQGKRHPYGDFVSAAATLSAPEEVSLKTQAQYTLIGEPVRHKNSLDRITGQAGFGIDVNVPNMLNAAIVQAPIFGTQAKAWDEQAALAVTGVKKVLVLILI